jgi:hypothetical protein
VIRYPALEAFSGECAARRPACWRRVAAFAALVLVLASARAGEAPGLWWQQLRVRDLKGTPLDPACRWLVVVFIGPECPVSNSYVPVLNKLAAEFTPRGFAFVGAYVDPTADLAALRAHAADYSIGFLTADDREHRLVKAAGASYTPEVSVFSADGARLYLGRIDDRVGDAGASRPAASHQELREVLAALESGAPGPFKGIVGYGCAIPEAVRP